MYAVTSEKPKTVIQIIRNQSFFSMSLANLKGPLNPRSMLRVSSYYDPSDTTYPPIPTYLYST